MEKARVEMPFLALRAVDVVEWNRLLLDTDNKGTAHWRCTANVLRAAIDQTIAARPLHVVADRCGGRMRYGQVLQDMVPEGTVVVLDETPERSDYRIDGLRQGCTLTFLERGEDHAMPVALASCLAKYLRELLVERLNAWFQSRLPELRATAGYYSDGHRFLAEASALVDAPGFPRERLIRAR
jgi:ribonuclease HII